MNQEEDAKLFSVDPEIEQTFRARRREQQRLRMAKKDAFDGVQQNLQPNIVDDRDRAILEY